MSVIFVAHALSRNDRAALARLEAIIRPLVTASRERYNIYDEWLPKMLAWNKDDPLKRYDEAMTADGLFTVERLAPQ
jgi:hypothetical protein